jgi:hypothetical protein
LLAIARRAAGAAAGHPAHNGQQCFLAATLEDLRRDEKWFAKACDAVVGYWRDKKSGTGAVEELSVSGAKTGNQPGGLPACPV